MSCASFESFVCWAVLADSLIEVTKAALERAHDQGEEHDGDHDLDEGESAFAAALGGSVAVPRRRHRLTLQLCTNVRVTTGVPETW